MVNDNRKQKRRRKNMLRSIEAKKLKFVPSIEPDLLGQNAATLPLAPPSLEVSFFTPEARLKMLPIVECGSKA